MFFTLVVGLRSTHDRQSNIDHGAAIAAEMSDSDAGDSDAGDDFLLGFTFGNVDEHGKAELDYLDEVRPWCLQRKVSHKR